MRHVVISAIVALSLVVATRSPHAAAAAPNPAPAKETTADGWPNTKSGTLARRWVDAFSKGEKAMRETLPDILAAESLAKTSMDERMERYRGLQEKFGSLMLVKIEKSSASELVAVLADANMEQRSFTFKFQTASPYKLVSVSYPEQRSMHGFHH